MILLAMDVKLGTRCRLIHNRRISTSSGPGRRAVTVKDIGSLRVEPGPYDAQDGAAEPYGAQDAFSRWVVEKGAYFRVITFSSFKDGL